MAKAVPPFFCLKSQEACVLLVNMTGRCLTMKLWKK